MDGEKRKIMDLYNMRKIAVDDRKIIREMRENKFLQELYWEKQREFLLFVRKDLSVSPRRIIEFVTKYISSATYQMPCFFCGNRDTLIFEFSNYDQLREAELFYTYKEYQCEVQGKKFDFRCSACRRKNLDILEYYERELESETEKQKKERVQFLKELVNKDYLSYLKTTHWSLVRSLIPLIQCDFCGKRRREVKRLELHHKSYEHLGEEENFLADLQALCSECHAERHGKEESDEI